MATKQPERPAPAGDKRPAAVRPGLTLAEGACLAAVHQGIRHGWGIGSVLAADGEIGRIWTLSRPLTYRSIDALVERRLLTRRGTQAGRGRERTMLHITAAGKRHVEEWLDTPVEHVRDVRTELLVKLAFRERAGVDVAPLLQAQKALFAPMIDGLTSSTDEGFVEQWRRESARAVRRFLDNALDPERTRKPGTGQPPFRLSARNQLSAKVTSVTHGDVMSTVRVSIANGQQANAAITKDAAVDLDLAAGDDVVVIVKSTEVMIAKPPDAQRRSVR